MKKAYVIVNPTAGKSQADRFFLSIIQNLQTGGYECTSRLTEKSGDADEFAEEAALSGKYDVIVAIGGDGTYNEVVSGIKKSGKDIAIGYIPAGSTNDFADTLGLSTYMPRLHVAKLRNSTKNICKMSQNILHALRCRV